MTINGDGVLSSIVRQGDFFVVRNESHGVYVEYAPDGGPGAPITGAFAAHKGRVLLWNEQEATKILQDTGADAEDFMARQLRYDFIEQYLPENEPKKTRTRRLATLLVNMAEELDRSQGVWEGFADDFYKDIVRLVMPDPLDGRFKNDILRLQSFVPGILFEKHGKGWEWIKVSVDWAMVAETPKSSLEKIS